MLSNEKKLLNLSIPLTQGKNNLGLVGKTVDRW